MEEPHDDDWEHAFAVLPEPDSPIVHAWVRAVTLEPGPGEELRVSWDMYGDSIRFRWTQHDVVRLDVYREGVHRLTIPQERRPATTLRVDYRQDGLTGVVHVEVWPRFTYTDTLLHAG